MGNFKVNWKHLLFLVGMWIPTVMFGAAVLIGVGYSPKKEVKEVKPLHESPCSMFGCTCFKTK